VSRSVDASRVTVRIDDRCTACGLCLLSCGDGALRPAPGRPAVLDHRCSGCGACVEVCPVAAIAEIRVAAQAAPAGSAR